MTTKIVVFIFILIISICIMIWYLGTAVQVVDLSQSVTSGNIEKATSAIKNFTETQVHNEVNSIVRSIYLAIALRLVAIFGSIAAAILALFKR